METRGSATKTSLALLQLLSEASPEVARPDRLQIYLV